MNFKKCILPVSIKTLTNSGVPAVANWLKLFLDNAYEDQINDAMGHVQGWGLHIALPGETTCDTLDISDDHTLYDLSDYLCPLPVGTIIVETVNRDGYSAVKVYRKTEEDINILMSTTNDPTEGMSVEIY